MKTVLFSFVQLLLFLGVFLVGSFMNPLHMRWFVTHPTPESTRFFAPGGLLLALAVYVLILLVQAVTKRMTISTTIAFLLALALGLAAKFGFVTQ
ncbi:hypothetical protein FTO74_02840 [Granulicella sp. WH15]|uniref:hypothetical protein n=1 Tax=Granulicella sp. WH15 TaxID=2602070 RepID=UPI0013668AB6|nr:hypothetical protein [Granulicella sp. WH15]QHN02426.1 hypothetical protein FTO74_02840 [Granulicella sp. WH15]